MEQNVEHTPWVFSFHHEQCTNVVIITIIYRSSPFINFSFEDGQSWKLQEVGFQEDEITELFTIVILLKQYR